MKFLICFVNYYYELEVGDMLVYIVNRKFIYVFLEKEVDLRKLIFG